MGKQTSWAHAFQPPSAINILLYTHKFCAHGTHILALCLSLYIYLISNLDFYRLICFFGIDAFSHRIYAHIYTRFHPFHHYNTSLRVTLFVSLAWFIAKMYVRSHSAKTAVILSNDCYLSRLCVCVLRLKPFIVCCSFVIWATSNVMCVVWCSDAAGIYVYDIVRLRWEGEHTHTHRGKTKKSIKSTHFRLEHEHTCVYCTLQIVPKQIDHINHIQAWWNSAFM